MSSSDPPSQHHPTCTKPPSYKAKGVWVRHKTTNAVGYITMALSFQDWLELPTQVYVVFPPTPYNKQVAQIKGYSGGVYTTDDLVRLKGRRRKV